MNKLRRILVGALIMWVTVSHAQPVSVCFPHSADPGTIIGNFTVIDHPELNNRPDLKLFVTRSKEFGCGTGGCDQGEPFGVFYYDNSRWAIYNQSLAAMDPDARFFVTARSPAPNVFSQISTASNLVASAIILDHPLVNGNPQAQLFVTHDWTIGTTYLTNHVVVFYDNSRSAWAVVNSDGAPMPEDINFNVLVQPAGIDSFLFSTNPGNVEGHRAYLNHPLLNRVGATGVQITERPVTIPSSFLSVEFSVYRDSFLGRWYLETGDGSAFPTNAQFNVFVCNPSCIPAQNRIFTHTTTSGNVFGARTELTHPELNDDPDQKVVATRDLSFGGPMLTGPVGVGYVSNRWSLINENLQIMPTGVTFQVMVEPRYFGDPSVDTTTDNVEFVTAELDNFAVNGTPDARLFVSHDVTSSSSPLDSALGVLYLAGTNQAWVIYRQDASAMPTNHRLQVMVRDAGAFVSSHTSTAANVAGSYTEIDHPALNHSPNLRLVTTLSTAGSTIFTAPYGTDFDAGSGRWRLVTENGSLFPTGVVVNLAWTDPGPHWITHKTSPSNTIADVSVIRHPLLNRRSDLILIHTHVWQPGDNVLTSPTALNYDFTDRVWTLVSEDGGNLPVNVEFNLWVSPPSPQFFTQTSETGNLQFNLMRFDHPDLAGQPNSRVFVSRRRRTGEPPLDRHLGTWYNGFTWTVYDEGQAALPTNVTFQAFVPASNDTVITHIATSGNTTNHITYIDHPELNAAPDRGLWLEHDYASGGPYLDRELGLWYDETSMRWTIFAEDIVPIPDGAVFQVFVVGGDVDNDGIPDPDENAAGTNPRNPDSGLSVTSMQRAPYANRLTWSSAPDHCYAVEFSTNLQGGTWQSLGCSPATGFTHQFYDYLNASSNRIGHYRIRPCLH